MKHLMILLVAGFALAVPAFAAQTYYVSKSGDDAWDGKAPAWDGTHGPKATIRVAVGLTDEGDTVSVGAGVYGDEQGYVAKADASDYYNCRVLIGRSITLVAPEGRDRTVIVGRLDTTDSQVGDNAIAGVLILEDAASARVEGFTFRDCASNKSKKGAAVLYTGGYKGLTGMPWIVDCAAENCRCYLGTFAQVNVARTIVRDCHTIGSCSVGAEANFVHCVFSYVSDGTSSAPLHDNPALRGGGYVVNCTFARLGSSTAVNGNAPTYMYNCVVTENASTSSDEVRAGSIFNCVAAIDSATHFKAATGNSGENYAYFYQIAAPLLDDYRPVASLSAFNFVTPAKAATLGDPKWLADIPEEFRWKDVYGTAFEAKDGHICAGAVQTTMTPVAGFATSSASIDGRSPYRPRKGRDVKSYVMSDEWPRLYTLSNRFEQAGGIYHYYFGSMAGVQRLPEKDGSALFMPKRGEFVDNILARQATTNLWVKKSGNDTTGDGSEQNPFLTIQKAVDVVPNTDTTYAIIHVGPGDYADGGKTYGSDAIKTRVAVTQGSAFIAIRSTDGAEKTIIRGQKGSGEGGLGTDAVRCVKFANGQTQLQGFTLTDGYGHSDDSVVSSGGTAVYGAGERTIVADCIISNNYGGNSIVYNCMLLRCLVKDNGVATPIKTSAIFEGSSAAAVNSVFVDNRCKNLVVMKGVKSVNCTFYESLGSQMAIASAHGTFANCIVGKSYGTSANSTKLKLLGCIFNNFSYNASDGVNKEGTNFIKADPKFVDETVRDLRLVSDSPAFGNALNAWEAPVSEWDEASAYDNYYRWIARDMDGNDPFFVDGRPTIGAYFKPVLQRFSVSASGGLTVTSTVPSGAVDVDQEITVSASDEASPRPLAGLVVNGELQEGVASWTFRPADLPFLKKIEVSAAVKTQMVWYVATDGSDTRKGWTEDTAMQSFAAVMGKTVGGDVVVALPGTYETGSMTGAGITLPARVVVPEGVTLRSRDGAEKTVIRGERGSENLGLGAGAMRCVVLNKNACVKGFTLTGGATSTSGGRLECYGGGVLGIRTSSSIRGMGNNDASCYECAEDCIISNNVAYIGGGGQDASYVRCRFLGNISSDSGAAVREPWLLRECVIDRNRGISAVSEPYAVYGCTFGKDNVRIDGTTQSIPLQCDPGTAVWKVYNTLFLGGGSSNVRWAYNCAMPTGYKLNHDSTHTTFTNENPRVGNVAVDADYRPLLTSVAVDAANPEYRPAEWEGLDALGGQRVYNGALDIGALEADWRPQYAKDIAARLTVTDASPEVVESDSGTVLLSEGTTLEATWKGRPDGSTGYTLNFRVAEGGSAEVTVNGETKTFGAGLQSYAFDSESAVCELAVAATAGEVEILQSRRNLGMCVIVR